MSFLLKVVDFEKHYVVLDGADRFILSVDYSAFDGHDWRKRCLAKAVEMAYGCEPAREERIPSWWRNI